MILNSKNYKCFFGRISGFSYIIPIFFFALTACPSGPSGSNTKEAPVGMPAPLWTQTEYIFQNKTDGQITIKDSGWKVVLNANECVYIEHLPTSLDLAEFIKAGKGSLCGGSYRHCSDKLNASRMAGGYSDFKRDTNSRESYMEIYNVVDSAHLFETVGSPSADPSYKNPYLARCKSTSGGNNNPPPVLRK